MAVNGNTLIQWFEQFAPRYLAVDGDKVGLQVGTLQKEVNKVMVTLDVTEEVIDEAIEEKIDLIIVHHPILYRPLAQLRTDGPFGRLIEKCIKNDIAVYSAHTNLDIAKGGVNDWLAERLSLVNTEVLSVTYEEPLKKLVVFVPVAEEQKVREAIGDVGAGWIGQYSHCTYRTRGTGTFLPLEGSNPFIGQKGKVVQVDEVRIETIFPQNLEKKVIRAMLKAHPYEEVAYDIYPIEKKGEAYGLGRVGKLDNEMTLRDFTSHVKKAFNVPTCRVVGNLDAKVRKVAILGGDGNKYMNAALFKGVDVFVTGDVYFHTAQDALLNGLNLVDPGHHIEKVMIDGVTSILQNAVIKNKAQVEILGSKTNTEPFTFI
jgi:dinuclear metal center YbgI/SA1388 family protein